jgi:colanic acid/amylovoran biosynthesis glycosyltransferase
VRRRRVERELHLLEVGVRWPPETFVGWKLEGLAARGMRVTVASRDVFDPDVRLPGVELVRLPTRTRTARTWWEAVRAGLALLLTRPRRFVRLLRGIRRHVPPEARRRYGGRRGVLAMCLPLASLRPDVVHFEWHGSAVDHLPLYDVWGCPIATSCRGSDLNVYPHVPGLENYTARLPRVLERVSAVHCVSESLKWEAVAFGLEPGKARVIRPSVDPALFRANDEGDRDAEDDVLRLISVGWLRWEKGHEYALQAIRALLDRDVPARLEILGRVPEEWNGRSGERERILHTVADLDLDGHVHLRGHASSADVGRRLRASDALLHAAVTEGIPNAIVEAMACRLPVVAAGCGGVGEAVTDGVEGFLVAPREPEQMADAVVRLWRDPALRARMGRAGRERVLSELTLEHEHRAFLAMYREVTGA